MPVEVTEGNPNVDHIPEPENTDARERMLSRAQEAVKAEKRKQSRAAGTKAWLEGKLNEQTSTVPVMGREFEFRPIGSDAVADVLDALPDGEADISDFPRLLRRMADLLADACTDPEMDREAFGMLQATVLEGVFEDVAMPENTLTPEQQEQIESFRGE